MPQLAQTNAPAISDRLLPAQQDSSAECVMLYSIGKEGDGTELNEPRNSLDRNVEEGTEHLFKLIASLEACNAALLNKLVQTQKELTALRQLPANALPGMELADHHEHSCGWERKLTRMGWRPS